MPIAPIHPRPPRRLVAASALALAACLHPPQPPPAASPAVTLTVAPVAPRFSPGEPIELAIELQNAGAVATRVSPIVDGNLRIVSLERDGAAVSATEATISYSTSLRTVLAQSLVALAPGARARATWTTRFDGDQNLPALQVVHYDPEGVHRVQSYGVGAPGTYTMHVIYRFGNPWTQPADVFTGETNVAKVTFVVGP